MSAFFALFSRDGSEISPGVSNTLFKEACLYPHDDSRLITRRNVVAGQASLFMRNADALTPLPLEIDVHANRYLIAGVFRLDNRPQLYAMLETEPATYPSDAHLIVLSYVKWGVAFVEKLLGEYSFVIYDEAADALHAVRDPMGVRPLYFTLNEKFCLFSDAIEVILQHPHVSHALNIDVLAEWTLTLHSFNKNETFLKDVHKCPRATRMEVTPDSVDEKEYWKVQDVKPLALSDEAEYVSALKNLLETVVRDRCDIDFGVAAHSSGGLDSTAIAILAGRVLKERKKVLHTYNWCKPVAEDEAKESHEWEDARKVAAMEGFVHTEVETTADVLKRSMLEHNIALDGTANYEYEKVLLPKARELGVRQIFSGFGGDEILTARKNSDIFGYLRRGELFVAYRKLRKRQRGRLRRFRALRQLFRFLILSIMPQRIRYKAFFDAQRNSRDLLKSALNKDFQTYAMSKVPLQEQLFFDSIKTWQIKQINSGYHQERMESWAALGRRSGIRYTFPLLDQRIVVFACGLDEDWYFKNEQSRYLYRLALNGMLPPDLLIKQKPPETFRVGYLLQHSLEAMRSIDWAEVLEEVPEYFDTSSFTNKHTEYINNMTDGNIQMEYYKLACVLLAAVKLEAMSRKV